MNGNNYPGGRRKYPGPGKRQAAEEHGGVGAEFKYGGFLPDTVRLMCTRSSTLDSREVLEERAIASSDGTCSGSTATIAVIASGSAL